MHQLRSRRQRISDPYLLGTSKSVVDLETRDRLQTSAHPRQKSTVADSANVRGAPSAKLDSSGMPQ
ncbi:hypothetical protein CTTA_3887 [Comamonas testosteroni]|uniref:Uncharacterized protein n=1 Tax=Comamonas testosteroni TaxID=285 RepID=A0A5A7MGT3_COMTE|nr:hypothetical protein CTTA_3887 [Comamonas testosteroni]